ncbi:MAG: Cof-type HAD-IIB family hydrolase [Butyricicoccus sp.]|nr:Cof-type HAD-IIB family hydrolase [Butyricicoccus sp.]
MANYKLLALDLDGTLLNTTSRVSKENARAVRLAQQAGVQIILCTGRNWRETRVFNRQLEAPADWAVIANGAAAECMTDGRQIVWAGMDRQMCDTVLAICAQFDTDPCLYTGESLYYGREFLRFLQEIRNRGSKALDETAEGYFFIDSPEKWNAMLEREDGHILKAILHDLDPKRVDQLIQALEQTGQFELAPSIMYGGALKNVEVNRKGVHKGSGLEQLAAELGFGMDAVMAIGDSDNDLSMLRMAGLGVAMANAAPHIQQAADVCTGSNAEDGVAQAIYRYILEGNT